MNSINCSIKISRNSMNKGYILEEIGEGLIHEPTIKRKETKYLKNKKGGAKKNCTMKEEAKIMINVFLGRSFATWRIYFLKIYKNHENSKS